MKLRQLRIPGAAVVPWVVPASILLSVATFLASGRSSVTTVSSNYIPPGTFVFETIAVESYPGTLAAAFEISPGTVSVRNDSSSWLHLIIDLNGFFQ